MIIAEHIEQYAKKYTTPLSALLQEVERYTQEYHPEAHMLSGPLQGQFLQMISHMLKPKRILEIGTFTGYSALCLAAGLKPEGHLHTIELREKDATVAQHFFEQSKFKNQITLHIGNAKTIIPQLNQQWDLVFIDADKVGYVDYYNLVLPHVLQGGFIIADNVLYDGEVLESPIKGKNAIAIQAFNDCIAKDSNVDSLMLTLRDGLMLIQKK